MFFNSIKEIKERNTKYLFKSYYWEKLTCWKLQFFKFKKTDTRSVLGISNSGNIFEFSNFLLQLKIQRSRSNTGFGFSIIVILKELCFKGERGNLQKWVIYYTKTSLLKKPFFMFFYWLYFCCFTFKNALSCLFKYF